MWFTCKEPKIINHVAYVAEFENGITENEYDYVLVWKYNWEKINPNVEEVMNYRWVSLEELRMDIEDSPDNFTPWMKIIMDRDLLDL